MKIKCIVILGLTTFGLMAFAGCGGDDSADKTARTSPPETTAAPELPAQAVVALDRLNASVDRLKLLAASFPDCGKEPQIRRERLRARRLAGQLSAATGITYRRNEKHLSPQQADEIRSRLNAAADTEGSINPALRACRDQRCASASMTRRTTFCGASRREREQAAQEARG
jgi:hypothetical protein